MSQLEISHVFNRSARRHDCFLDDRDRWLFLEILGEACVKHNGHVIAYCLMGNHYHLILRSTIEDRSRIMKHLSERYTRAFNTFHAYDGPLFKGRYRSVVVEDERQLIALSRYVHRNPLELGVLLGSYPWSSYPAFLGMANRPDWLIPDEVLRLGTGSDGYRRFIETDADCDTLSIADGRRAWLPEPAVEKPSVHLAQIDHSVQRTLGESGQPDVSSGCRTSDFRRLAILLAIEQRVHSTAEIASHYGYASPTSLRNAAARARRTIATSDQLSGALDRARLLIHQQPVTPV